MAKTKTRSKTYRPRPVSRFGGMTAIAKQNAAMHFSQPLEEDRQQNVVIAYHQSIEAMKAGYAEAYHFDTIVYALNIGRILAERGIGAEYMDLIEPALQGMWRAKQRYLSTNRMGLDGDGLAAIEAVADLHAEQVRIATQGELHLAIEEMHRRIDAGKEYEREAA